MVWFEAPIKFMGGTYMQLRPIGNHFYLDQLRSFRSFLNAVTEFIPVSVFPSELDDDEDQDDTREQLINNIRKIVQS